MKTKKNKAKGLINWKYANLHDIEVGDLVKVTTITDSQKYEDEYNKTRIGFLIKKENNLCNCKIKTRLNKIKKLCIDIGTSGITRLYKATPRYRAIMRREIGKKIIDYSDDDDESVILDNYGSSSSEVSNSRSRSRSRGRTRRRRRSRTRSRRRSRSISNSRSRGKKTKRPHK